MDTNAPKNKIPAATVDSLEKRIYTVSEIAKLLCISKSKAYELCSGKCFPVIRLGKSVRVSKASFDAWLAHLSNEEEQNKNGIYTREKK